MDKEQAKKNIRMALQPWLNTNDVMLALVMQDEQRLNEMRDEVNRLRKIADNLCEQVDRCDSEECIAQIVGKVSRD